MYKLALHLKDFPMQDFILKECPKFESGDLFLAISGKTDKDKLFYIAVNYSDLILAILKELDD